MRTDFHAILRNNADELSREEIDSMSYEEARSYYWSVTSKTRKAKPKDNRDSVCFTGFTTAEKNELASVAEQLNHKVVKSVVVKLNYLVFGPNAGPKKLEKATAQGVAIITDADYREMVQAES